MAAGTRFSFHGGGESAVGCARRRQLAKDDGWTIGTKILKLRFTANGSAGRADWAQTRVSSAHVRCGSNFPPMRRAPADSEPKPDPWPPHRIQQARLSAAAG